MHMMQRSSAGMLVRTTAALVVAMLLAGTARSVETAQVPGELLKDRSYTTYASLLIQIDMFSNPTTADLPVAVTAPQAGQIHLSGAVPSSRLQRYLVENAKRISGLEVTESLRVGRLAAKYEINVAKGKLEYLTTETLTALFPELRQKVKTSVSNDGVVILTGEVPSYEAKLMLSQAVKSQPGCKAVANLLAVAPKPRTGVVSVTEDGSLALKVSMLPVIPAAPLLSPVEVGTDEPPIKTLSRPRMVADDAPRIRLLDRQIREDAERLLDQEEAVRDAALRVDAADGIVTISGDLDSREQAEAIVNAVVETPGAKKIVARTKPVSIQRNIVAKDAGSMVRTQPRKLFGVIPLPGRSTGVESTRRFRETVRKTLMARCEDRCEDISVRSTLEGLLIEAEVKTPRDRNFVLNQVDNIVEIRAVPYTVVVQISGL